MFSNVKSTLFTSLDKHIFGKPHDSTCVSPRHTPFKWIALFFICLTTIGGYYCYGAPSSMQTPIVNVFCISTTHFNMLFTVYSLPNIVMPILGGFIIDKFGVRFGLLLFSSLICIGQAFVVLGAYVQSFNVMIAGGVALGVGLESLCAAKCAIVLKWFQGQELSLAMGLTLTISRLGQSLSSFLAPWLYARDQNLALPFNVGLLLGIFSVIMVLILCFLDIYADDREENIVSYQTRSREVFKISDMKEFKFIYHLIVLNCMIVYSVIICFLNNCNDLMNKRFGFTPQLSGNYISIIFIMATILSPVFGGIIDRIGRRAQMILVSIIIMALVHFDVAFLSDTEQ